MKSTRQNAILEIISSEDVETQNQLLERLRERGKAVRRPRFRATLKNSGW